MRDPSALRGAGVLWTGASSVLVGVLGLLGLALAARGLRAEGYTTFAVVWGLVYGIGGAFAGLQQEVTRAGSRWAGSDRAAGPGQRLLVSAAVLVLPASLVGAVATRAVLGPGNLGSAAVVGAGLVGMGLLTYVCGVEAARGRWRALAVLLVADAAIRTGAVALLLRRGDPSLSAAAIASGSVLWSVLLVLPAHRAALRQRGVGTLGAFAGRGLAGMLSAGCAGLVVAGLPVLVAALRPGGLTTGAATVVAAMSLIRSALLLLVYGYRPMLLRHFLHARTLGRSVVLAWLLCGAAGVGYAVVAWTWGPAVLRLLLGRTFDVAAPVCAALAVGAVGLAALVVSGLALVADDRHLASGAGWLVALTATCLVVVPAPSTEAAVVLAASSAPWAGVLAHAVALGWPRSRGQSSPSENADSRS